jgi:hypothetical protein
MKLDNNVIEAIIHMIAPATIRNLKLRCNEERMKCIWKYLDKKKLYDVDKLIKKRMII